MNYSHLITIEPGKRSGKPCIRGLRITVYDVLEYLAAGMAEDEILADFSELAPAPAARISFTNKSALSFCPRLMMPP